MTQKDLAARVGISQSFLSELENNKYDMTLSMLFKISEVLNVCPYSLVGYNNKNTDDSAKT